MSRKGKSASEKKGPATSTQKILKGGSGDKDEKGEFTGVEHGPGDDDEVVHDGKVMLMKDDDDGEVLLQLRESYQRQMGESQKYRSGWAVDNTLERHAAILNLTAESLLRLRGALVYGL